MSQITEEIIHTPGIKPFKIRAIQDGKIYGGAESGKPFKKGDIFEAKFIGSMIFFLVGGGTSSFYKFEILD